MTLSKHEQELVNENQSGYEQCADHVHDLIAFQIRRIKDLQASSVKDGTDKFFNTDEGRHVINGLTAFRDLLIQNDIIPSKYNTDPVQLLKYLMEGNNLVAADLATKKISAEEIQDILNYKVVLPEAFALHLSKRFAMGPTAFYRDYELKQPTGVKN